MSDEWSTSGVAADGLPGECPCAIQDIRALESLSDWRVPRREATPSTWGRKF